VLSPVTPPPSSGNAAPAAPFETAAPSSDDLLKAAPHTEALPKPPFFPRNPKTRFDTFCGFGFILMGLAAAVYFGYTAFGVIGDLSGAFTQMGGLGGFGVITPARNIFVILLAQTAGGLFGFAAGIILLLGGFSSLHSGRGKNSANTATVLMIFTLIWNAIGIWLKYLWGFIPAGTSPLQVILTGWIVYTLEIAFVVFTFGMLAFKTQNKRWRRAALRAAYERDYAPDANAVSARERAKKRESYAEYNATVEAHTDYAPEGSADGRAGGMN
jgi:hypothetical protein